MMVDRYGPKGQPMQWRGFAPSATDFERVRVGIDQRIFSNEYTIPIGGTPGLVDLDIAGEWVLFDTGLDCNFLTGRGTIELNSDTDVGNSRITIARGMVLKSPFTGLRLRWPAGNGGRLIRIHYGSGIPPELFSPSSSVDVSSILGGPTSTQAGAMFPDAFPIMDTGGRRIVLAPVGMGNGSSSPGINAATQIFSPPGFTVESYLLDLQVQCRVSSGANRLVVCTGTVAPTTAFSNPIVGILRPAVYDATAALYTMRFDLPRPIQMDLTHGLWLFNAGAVAATDTTFAYWQAGT